MDISKKIFQQLFCVDCEEKIISSDDILKHKNHQYDLISNLISYYKYKLSKKALNIERVQQISSNQIIEKKKEIEYLEKQSKELEELNKLLFILNKDELSKFNEIDLLLKWWSYVQKEQIFITKQWNFVNGDMKIEGNSIKKLTTTSASHNRFCVLDQKIEKSNFKFKVIIKKFNGWIGIGVVTEKLRFPKNNNLWEYMNEDCGFFGISSNGYFWNHFPFKQKQCKIDSFKEGDEIEVSIFIFEKLIHFKNQNGKEHEIKMEFNGCLYPAIQLNNENEEVSFQILS